MRSTKFTVADLKRGLAKLGCVRERSSGAKLIYSYTDSVGKKTTLPPFLARRDAAEVNMNEVTKLRYEDALALLHLDLWAALADDLPSQKKVTVVSEHSAAMAASNAYRDAVMAGWTEGQAAAEKAGLAQAIAPPPLPSQSLPQIVDRKLAEFAGWTEDPPKPKRKPGSPIPAKDKLEAVREQRALRLSTAKGRQSIASGELAARLGYAWSDMYRWDRLLREAGHLGLPIPDAAVSVLENARRPSQKPKQKRVQVQEQEEEKPKSNGLPVAEVEALMRAGDIVALDDLLKARGLTLSDVRSMMARHAEIEAIRSNPEAAFDRIQRLEERLDKLVKDLGGE